jgi:hypothetical protein
MARYYVVAEMTISVGTEVEARSAEQAKDIASRRGVMTLCHSCASNREGRTTEWCTSGELDGEPEIVAVEELG